MRFAALVPLLCSCLWSVASQGEMTRTTDPTDPSRTIVRLTVTPAPEPTPAFRHRLSFTPAEQSPGNAAQWYYRAILQLDERHQSVREDYPEYDGDWIDAEATSLDELPREQVRDALARLNEPLEALAEATRRSYCHWDWNLQNIHGPELVEFLLPEMQESRALARVLDLQARLAIAEGRFEDAIQSIRTTYQMAQHVAEEPLLVVALVAIAEASIANGALTELIAAPDSPNLYWALSELPSPVVSVRDAMRFELSIVQRIFPFLTDAHEVQHSAAEWGRLWNDAWRNLVPLAGGEADKSTARMGGFMMSLLNYGRAKEWLILEGFDPEEVEQMPVGQVLAIYTQRTSQRLAHEFEKALYVPHDQSARFNQQAEALLKGANPVAGGPGREILPISSMLLPASTAARNAQVRLEREVAALRVIEALRMHAAQNEGRLPTTLAEVTSVPVPTNPATGEEFHYSREAETAILELPKSDGVYGSVRYEITIAP